VTAAEDREMWWYSQVLLHSHATTISTTPILT